MCAPASTLSPPCHHPSSIYSLPYAQGSTPLILAAHAGHAAVAEMLLKEGADVHAKDEVRVDPLLSATLQPHFSIVNTSAEKRVAAFFLSSAIRPQSADDAPPNRVVCSVSRQTRTPFFSLLLAT